MKVNVAMHPTTKYIDRGIKANTESTWTCYNGY